MHIRKQKQVSFVSIFDGHVIEWRQAGTTESEFYESRWRPPQKQERDVINKTLSGNSHLKTQTLDETSSGIREGKTEQIQVRWTCRLMRGHCLMRGGGRKASVLSPATYRYTQATGEANPRVLAYGFSTKRLNVMFVLQSWTDKSTITSHQNTPKKRCCHWQFAKFVLTNDGHSLARC